MNIALLLMHWYYMILCIIVVRNYLWKCTIIKTKNHVRACPLLKIPYIHFIFAEINQYTYKSHCFKINFHTYTRVQKQIQKFHTTCVQIFRVQKYGPLTCIISNHVFLVIKSS